METIRISVITVCYNAEKVMEDTVRSVLSQDYDNLEYIIVDGASSDGTLSIIRKYENDKRINWVSEPDKGIYDAMNKGIAMAEGDYIQFLNAGDVFIDVHVVRRMAVFLRQNATDIAYGHILYRYPDDSVRQRSYTQFCASKFYYLLGDCINHQAIFAKRECLEKGFDISYKICADREWMLRMKKAGYKFQASNLVICEYSLSEESISIKNRVLSDQEVCRCIKTHLAGGYWLFAFVNWLRRGKWSAKVLHILYKIIYIR